MEPELKEWTKDQQRVIIETFRANKTPYCPTDKTEIKLTFKGKVKGKNQQKVHYSCQTCSTTFDFSPNNEDMKWRRMNESKKR